VHSISLVAFAFSGAALLATQAPSVSSQDPPTFRSGVDLIEVDVIVTDRDGNPVRDLTKDDFEIVEDGRAQELRTFLPVDLPVPPPVPVAQPGRLDLEPDTATNAVPDGRTYVLLLDSPSTMGSPIGSTLVLRVKQLARQFLAEAVRPGDDVAVVHVQGSTTDGQGFTSNLALVDRSIERYGRGVAGSDVPFTGHEAVTRTLATYRAIQDLAERLGTLGGRRKTIVWMGGQIDVFPERYGELCRDPDCKTHPVFAATAILQAALRDAIQAAARNNVAVYPVDPSGLTAGLGSLGRDELIRQASLRSVAEDTGGIATVNTNNFTDAYAAIVRDASTYYLLGYSPDRNHPQDGSFHPITVRVRRPDITVRARRGYYSSAAGAVTTKALPPPPEGVSLAARDALRRPLATKGLGIDVAAATFKSSGNDASVVITAHVRGQTLDFAAGRRLAVSYQVFDVDGRVSTGFYKVFSFNLKPDNLGRATERGLQFVERITLRPGRYELRLAAEQPDGPIGSVIAHIDAKFEGNLAMSGVVLAARRTSEVLLVNDRDLRTALSADPTALRSFRAADGLSAYAEVYTELSRNVSAVESARVKVATLTGTITTAGGTFVTRSQGVRVTVDADRSALREGFRSDFDLSRVAPGAYVLSIEARSSETGGRLVRRQIPFTVE
jgi:VWFA-related protein